MYSHNKTNEEEQLIQELFSNHPLKTFSKNEIIIPPQSIHRNVFLIERGITRTFYYNSKGEDITHWFSTENDIITVLSSTLDQSESTYGLQALENNTKLRIIPFDTFVKFKDSSTELNQILEKLIISSFIKVANRLVDIQTKTGKERYENLMKEHPSIFQRVNLSHIATYLGIKRQSLSRIRASN